jgi:ADP-ribose pyrophosphatase YjhB (NUDIX family)
MRRVYPNQPLIGIGGIVFLEERVLLVKRKNPPGQGIWSIPGGLVKLGESLEGALKRELKEETTLKISVEKIVEVVERICPDSKGKIKYHYVIIDFLCSLLRGEAKAQSDALALRWQSVKELDKLSISKELEDIIKKAYRLWHKKDL